MTTISLKKRTIIGLYLATIILIIRLLIREKFYIFLLMAFLKSEFLTLTKF